MDNKFKKEYICECCGKTFIDWIKDNRRFCSNKCKYKYPWNKRCSKESQDKQLKTAFKKGLVPWNTGTKGVCKPNSGSFKKGIVPWIKGKKHSKESIEKFKHTFFKSEDIKGEKNPNWKGGITDEHTMIRRSKKYADWRNKVYARDNWTCQECGYKGNEIIAHHIYKFSKYKEYRFEVKNGITLCRVCHPVIESIT